LTVYIKKCSFAQQEVKYLGHIIGSGKHRRDPDRLRAVKEMKVPITKKQLQQMMGYSVITGRMLSILQLLC